MDRGQWLGETDRLTGGHKKFSLQSNNGPSKTLIKFDIRVATAVFCHFNTEQAVGVTELKGGQLSNNDSSSMFSFFCPLVL